MTTSKFGRNILLVAAIMIGLLTAACGGNAPAATAAPSGGDTSSTGGGSPSDAVKGFFDALYSGADASSFVCSAAGSEEMKAAFEQAATTMTASGAKVTTDGLTYTVKDEDADSATVTVGGNLSMDIAGNKTDSPYTADVPVVKEGDAWKICG